MFVMNKYKIKKLGTKLIPKGKGDNFLSMLMRDGLLLNDIKEMGKDSDLIVIAARQNRTNYYSIGAVNNNSIDRESVSFIHGNSNPDICDNSNNKLPKIVNAQELLLANMDKIFKHLYCDESIANVIQDESIEEVNTYLNFCEKYGSIKGEDKVVSKTKEEDVITLKTLDERLNTPAFSFGKSSELTAGEILADLDIKGKENLNIEKPISIQENKEQKLAPVP